MRSTRQEIVAYIDRRLATMDRAPGSWGSPESLELQALLLLEVRTFSLRPRTHRKNPFEARNVHLRLVRRHFPEAPASLLSAVLAPDQVESRLPQLLAELRRDVTALLPAEDPFSTNPLALELRFHPGKRASLRAVSRYLLRFMRAIEGDGPRRRWPLSEVRPVAWEDGSEESVCVVFEELGWGSETKRRLFGEIGKSLAVLDAACESQDAAQKTLIAGSAEGRERARCIENARRLCPAGRIAMVRIGGTALGRAPTRIGEAQARRVARLGGEHPPPDRVPVPEAWLQGAGSIETVTEVPHLEYRAQTSP